MLTLTFERERETKHKIRFAEVLEDGRERDVVGTLYVLKSQDTEFGHPRTLTVTITPPATEGS